MKAPRTGCNFSPRRKRAANWAGSAATGCSRVLGRGGMGLVLEAEDLKLGRHVAIKVMRPRIASDDKARDRFLREARAAAKVEHDHIIPIYFIGEENGVPYIVMPFLKGESLDDRLKRENLLPAPDILQIGRETAEGLAAAHDQGLVHRDIKPANLWLELPRGRVKILDFGLARLNSDSGQLTQSGAILGTPAYMSPEQARNRAIDGRTDLFSLGAVLYRMATGRTPFGGSDTMSTLMALATETPTHPQFINPDLPQHLSDLIMRLLHKDPRHRPQSAREVAGQLAPAPLFESMPAVAAGTHEEFDFGRDDPTHVDVPLATAAEPEGDSAPPSEASRVLPARAAGNRGLLFATVVAFLVLVVGGFAAYKMFFEARQGTLIVSVGDAEAESRFKNGELQLVDSDGVVKYRLKSGDRNKIVEAGSYKIKLIGMEGLEPDAYDFTMTKGGTVTVRLSAVPIVRREPVRKAKDTERAIAEWVLSVGGSMSVMADGQEIRVPQTPLPSTPFRIDTLSLAGNGLPERVDDMGLEKLHDIKDVRYALYLRDLAITDRGFDRLTQLPGFANLAALAISNLQVSDKGLAGIKRLKALKSLELKSTKITDAALEHLRDLKLTRLVFDGCTAIDGRGFVHLSGMKELKSLSLSNTQVVDSSLAYLKQLPKLGELNLINTKVTDDGLANIAELTALAKLSLENLPVSDTGVAKLGSLPKLANLDLRGTKVTDNVLESLSGLKLTGLNLGGCQGIDGSKFAELKKMTFLRLANQWHQNRRREFGTPRGDAKPD